VFGLPGSQNVALYEALRRSSLRTIVATHELAASFMANGYARASGKPGVLLTIPGPGFSYALTGLAEAFLDSAAVLHIAGRQADGPGRRFQLQALDQAAMAAPVVKRVFEVERVADLCSVLEAAYALTLSGEPGPVLVQLPARLLSETTGPEAIAPSSTSVAAADLDPRRIDEVAELLGQAERVLLYVGQGACAAASELTALAETLGAPVVTTTSARGLLPTSCSLLAASSPTTAPTGFACGSNPRSWCMLTPRATCWARTISAASASAPMLRPSFAPC
jgi:acetolactate synthase-1/2/3 large subunit